jgi:hypothetical protein
VAHPALLVPQKIPVDEDAILPYFPNLMEAVPGEFNATPFFMARKILFHELQDRVALNIWPHSINILPDQSNPYDIPKDTFYNSQILSQNCMLKPTKEDNDASFLAMENYLFGRLFDAMKDQSQAMYAFMEHISPHSNEPTIQETPDDDEISRTPPHSNKPHIQESPDGDEIVITPPYMNELPMQETPDNGEIATSSEGNSSP